MDLFCFYVWPTINLCAMLPLPPELKSLNQYCIIFTLKCVTSNQLSCIIMTLNQIILQTCLYVTHSRTSLWMLKLQILQISLRCYFIWVKIKFVPERFSSAPYKMIALVMIIIQINSSQVKLHNYLTHYHATTIVLHCSSIFFS